MSYGRMLTIENQIKANASLRQELLDHQKKYGCMRSEKQRECEHLKAYFVRREAKLLQSLAKLADKLAWAAEQR